MRWNRSIVAVCCLLPFSALAADRGSKGDLRLGLDVGNAVTAYPYRYGSNFIPTRNPVFVPYLGVNLSEHVGLELGYELVRRRAFEKTLEADEWAAGFQIPYAVPEPGKSPVHRLFIGVSQWRAFYLDMPLRGRVSESFEIYGKVGVGFYKFKPTIHVDSIGITDPSDGDSRWVIDHDEVGVAMRGRGRLALRFGAGGEYALTRQAGIRGGFLYERTKGLTVFGYKERDRREFELRMKNVASLHLGAFFKF